MVRDRMSDLCAKRNNDTSMRRGFFQDVNIQISHNKKLKQILDQVDEIRALINLISENINIVKNLHNNIQTHTSKDIRKELESRTFTISQTSFQINKKLREMGNGIAPIDDLSPDSVNDGPVYTRIKTLQYSTMIRMFSEIMEDYNLSLIRYHEKCLLLLHQQRNLIRRNITSQELDDMVDAQETSLFVDNILEDSRIAKQQLSEIQSRHNDVLMLEKSITEIRDMFNEIAFLVERQGDQLNTVEYFAGTTTDNVDIGRTDLKKAQQKRNRLRKKKIKCYIILIIVMVLLFIILLVV